MESALFPQMSAAGRELCLVIGTSHREGTNIQWAAGLASMKTQMLWLACSSDPSRRAQCAHRSHPAGLWELDGFMHHRQGFTQHSRLAPLHAVTDSDAGAAAGSACGRCRHLQTEQPRSWSSSVGRDDARCAGKCRAGTLAQGLHLALYAWVVVMQTVLPRGLLEARLEIHQ